MQQRAQLQVRDTHSCAGEGNLLFRIAFPLVIGLMFCGCSDRSETTIRDVSKHASTVESYPTPERLTAATATTTHKFDGPRDVVCEGRVIVDVMEIGGPPRANELAQRLQQAARENPGFWLEHAKRPKPGEPLPYDSRLGLSEAEYKEFLSLAKKLTMRKKAEAALVVATEDNEVFVLDGGEALPDFTGIVIDLKGDLVRTPFGVLTERSEIDAPEDSAFGAWVGTQWKLNDFDPSGITGTAAKLAVGKLRQSGRSVIYYDVRRISLDGKTRISHVLNYDMPARESGQTVTAASQADTTAADARVLTQRDAAKGIQGVWEVVYYRSGNRVDYRRGGYYVFTDEELKYGNETAIVGPYTLDVTTSPKRIEHLWFGQWRAMKGIYKIEDNQLTICWRTTYPDEYPSNFSDAQDSAFQLLKFERVRDDPTDATPVSGPVESNPRWAKEVEAIHQQLSAGKALLEQEQYAEFVRLFWSPSSLRDMVPPGKSLDEAVQDHFRPNAVAWIRLIGILAEQQPAFQASGKEATFDLCQFHFNGCPALARMILSNDNGTWHIVNK